MATRWHRHVEKLERIVRWDRGSRGIRPLALSQGYQLRLIAQKIADSPTVGLITGFPCRKDRSPPTENDGPSGTLAVARAAMLLHKNVVIATDECNGNVLDAGVRCVREQVEARRAAGPAVSDTDPAGTLELVQFPPLKEWDDRGVQQQRLYELARRCGIWIAIERAGPASDGSYYTMKGIPMDELMVPLERIFDFAHGEIPVIPCVGVGDGGNEVGMGTVRHLVAEHIPLGDKIGCVTECDHLVVAGVSNWGGWGIAGAVEALYNEPSTEAEVTPHRPYEPDLPQFSLLPTDEEEAQLADVLASAGAFDGISGVQGRDVDGIPFEEHLQVLAGMRSRSEERGPWDESPETESRA